MVFTILKSKGCSEAEFKVLRALDKVIFFRIRDFSILHFYNYRAAPILTAFFAGPLPLDEPLTLGNQQPSIKSQTQPQPSPPVEPLPQPKPEPKPV